MFSHLLSIKCIDKAEFQNVFMFKAQVNPAELNYSNK